MVLGSEKPTAWPLSILKFLVCSPALQATSRLRKNASYFKVNYLIVVLLTTALSFLLHPASLIAVALLSAAWVYLFLIRTTPLEIGGRTFS